MADNEPNAIVSTVKDLILFLSTLDPEMPITHVRVDAYNDSYTDVSPEFYVNEGELHIF